MSNLLNWLLHNYLEILGTIFGLLYIYLSAKQSIGLWFVGILTSGFYIIVFFRTQLYADMSLNVYYLLVSIYGWYHWTRKTNPGTSNAYIGISTLRIRHWIEYLVSTLVLCGIFYWILKIIPEKIGLSPSSAPFWDALTTAGSIIATWMLARKVLEQWLWWIIIDVISIGLFLYKELYVTVILFAVYTIMAVWGYFSWQSQYKEEKT